MKNKEVSRFNKIAAVIVTNQQFAVAGSTTKNVLNTTIMYDDVV